MTSHPGRANGRKQHGEHPHDDPTLAYSGEEKAMAYAQLGQHLQFLRASLRRHQNGAEAFNAASLMFERAAF